MSDYRYNRDVIKILKKDLGKNLKRNNNVEINEKKFDRHIELKSIELKNISFSFLENKNYKQY